MLAGTLASRLLPGSTSSLSPSEPTPSQSDSRARGEASGHPSFFSPRPGRPPGHGREKPEPPGPAQPLVSTRSLCAAAERRAAGERSLACGYRARCSAVRRGGFRHRKRALKFAVPGGFPRPSAGTVLLPLPWGLPDSGVAPAPAPFGGSRESSVALPGELESLIYPVLICELSPSKLSAKGQTDSSGSLHFLIF